MNSVENKIQENSNVSINLSNNSNMTETNFKLNIDFTEVEEAEKVEVVRKSNQPALERIVKLAKMGYYFFLQLKTSKKGEAYLWVKATKQSADRIEFALYVNDVVLNTVVAILLKKSVDISEINADDLDDFNNRITNFEYILFITERAQGRTMNMTYTANGQTFSSFYKQGVIIYRPYLNPELKAYVNA